MHGFGIPVEIRIDGVVRWLKHNIYQTIAEPRFSWQNPEVGMGGKIQQKFKAIMRRSNIPVRL